MPIRQGCAPTYPWEADFAGYLEQDPSYLFTEPDPSPLRRGPKRTGAESRTIHRKKILSAVIRESADRGLTEALVGDISRRARVSRRTFYEHFESKESAFLTAFSFADIELRRALQDSLSPVQNWADRILVALRTYLDVLTRNPALTRMFVVEIAHAGSAGREHESRHEGWWSDLLRSEVADARRTNPELATATRDLSDDMSFALISGFNGLTRRWLEHGDLEKLFRGWLMLFISVISNNAHRVTLLLGQTASDPQFRSILRNANAREDHSGRRTAQRAPC